MSDKVIVYFDGACPMCKREIALVRRLDWRSRIDFIDVAQPEVGATCPLDPADLLQRFHVTDSKGELHSGAAAFAAMWRATPLLAPLGYLARIPPVLWVLERLYRGYLKVRPRLQTAFGGRTPHAST